MAGKFTSAGNNVTPIGFGYVDDAAGATETTGEVCDVVPIDVASTRRRLRQMFLTGGNFSGDDAGDGGSRLIDPVLADYDVVQNEPGKLLQFPGEYVGTNAENSAKGGFYQTLRGFGRTAVKEAKAMRTKRRDKVIWTDLE